MAAFDHFVEDFGSAATGIFAGRTPHPQQASGRRPTISRQLPAPASALASVCAPGGWSLVGDEGVGCRRRAPGATALRPQAFDCSFRRPLPGPQITGPFGRPTGRRCAATALKITGGGEGESPASITSTWEPGQLGGRSPASPSRLRGWRPGLFPIAQGWVEDQNPAGIAGHDRYISRSGTMS